jgi:glycosyltransferase involved in cell wall biosynthesis
LVGPSESDAAMSDDIPAGGERAEAPLVSVITPAYNAERFIAETIDSVLAQTYTSWELIVVDDRSTDGTAALIESYADQRIRLVDGGGTGLPAAARNRGFAEARGDYVALLDHDDYWRPTKLERQMDVMLSRPEVGFVHTAADLLRDGKMEPGRPDPEFAREDDMLARLLENNFIYASSVLVRRELIEQHGGQDEDPGLRATPDYEHWLRLAPHTVFAYVPETLLVYRLHDSNVTANRAQVGVGIALAVEKTSRRNPELVGRKLPGLDRTLGIHRCLAGMKGSGRRDLWRAVRGRPTDLLAWKWLGLSLLGSGVVRRLQMWRG